MFKFLIATIAMLFTAAAFAVGPSQMWRLEVTKSAENGIVEISEIELLNASDESTTDLLRNFTHEESVGATVWTIEHNLAIQPSKTSVDVVAVDTSLETITPDDITIVDKNTILVTFASDATGIALINGVTFDSPLVNKRGNAVPSVEFLEDRPAAAIFDGNAASKFKSSKAPTTKDPLVFEYIFWIGDMADPNGLTPEAVAGRWPNVVKYTIQVPNKATAPSAWKLLYWKDGKWNLADQQAAQRFDDGEKKTFEVNEF